MSYEDVAAAAGPRWTYGKRGYALAQSLRQLQQRRFSTLVTLLVLGTTLALPAMLLFANQSLQQLSKRSIEGESLTAYLSETIDDLEGAALALSWTEQEGVRETRYISRDEALTLLRENTDLGNAIDILGTNPLPGAIVVYPQSAVMQDGRVESLAERLRQHPAVARVQLDLRWVQRLQAVVSLGQRVLGILALFLTLTAYLVITNTIRLELLRRRAEMEVANLLGAGSLFLNRPILYIGALYGLLGGVMASIIAIVAFNAIKRPADELSLLYESQFRLIIPETSQILAVLAISIILGMIGALSSMYRPSQTLRHSGHQNE